MTDQYSGARAPDGESKAQQVAGQTKEAAGQAATDVASTAKDQAQRVAGEAKQQAASIASDLRSKAGVQAKTQNDRLVGTIRQTADQLDEMRGDRMEGPAAAVVSRVADGGRQFADYLDHHGPEGVLREVQDFARRRPGAFLATALAAGFVVGRLGKSVAKADEHAGEYTKPSTDSFVSTTPDTGYDTTGYGATTGTGYATTGYDTGYTAAPGFGTTTATPDYPAATPGYPATADYPATTGTTGYTTGTETTGTEYAATGTGRPVVVEEEFIVDPERRP